LPLQSPCTDASPGSITTRFTYEPKFNQVATISDPLNHTTTYGYDAAGNLTSIRDPLQHQTTFTSNGQGQVTSVTDALEHTTTFEYAGADLTTITDPLNRVTTRFVDAAGRVLMVTNPQGQNTRFTYDANGQLRTVTDAMAGLTTLAYFPGGQLQSVTDANQHTTSHTYDAMGRLATRTDPLQRVERFTYDATGNPYQWIDRKGQVTTSTYDPLNRLHQISYADTSTITYLYDQRSRLTNIIDSASGTITREYDDLDRVLFETTPQGVVGYTYDASGRRETMTLTGQPLVTYTYDDANRLTGITRGISNITIVYDAANRRTSAILPNGVVAAYNYDNASQLMTVAYEYDGTPLANTTYTYEGSGNVASVTGLGEHTILPQPVSSGTYDVANQLIMWGNVVLSHDDNGNRASDGLTSYSWDARNRLTGSFGEITSLYGYDGLGRRTTRTVNGLSSSFRYDGTTLVDESSGGATRSYIAGADPDELFAASDSSNTYVRMADRNNSTLAWIGPTGSQISSFGYTAYGYTLRTGLSLQSDIGFTGRQFDVAGQYYYRARYYDAATGRFISPDPVGFSGGLNLYQYAAANPSTFRDPNGLDVWVSAEATAGMHFGLVGVNGSFGLVGNASTTEICLYTMGCLRPGFGVYVGGSAQLGASILGPHCGKDLNGLSVKVAVDVLIPTGEGARASAGLGGSAGKNNGVGVSGSVGPGLGAGISMGVDVCQMKVLKCWRTPDECKGCQK
jgi:RHS repeat-associated protein